LVRHLDVLHGGNSYFKLLKKKKKNSFKGGGNPLLHDLSNENYGSLIDCSPVAYRDKEIERVTYLIKTRQKSKNLIVKILKFFFF
jgi:hypothetical protein